MYGQLFYLAKMPYIITIHARIIETFLDLKLIRWLFEEPNDGKYETIRLHLQQQVVHWHIHDPVS